jgi:Tfp pilus assembly protein PilF
MRLVILVAACALASAQAPGPGSQPLARAYEALRTRDYDAAVQQFLLSIEAAPTAARARTDLAYTYLKIGENDLAREQFREVMRQDPENTQAALEYAFLCNDTGREAEARRVFDRLRAAGNPTAAQAFQNIDAPLAAGIERWQQALAKDDTNFNNHYELATLAERRDELALAAGHYEKAWRLMPSRRGVLVDLGRVWKGLNRVEDSTAALLAASRGGDPRAADLARELLPDRYPFVSEFRRALQLDPANIELRRELAFLLLRMDTQPDAEQEFHGLLARAPGDLLSATQLGFLLYARGETATAQPLFDRVLAGEDEDLANRVRAVLRMPQVLKQRDAAPQSIDAWVMAERSIQAGYLKDAVKYLQTAHEADPGNFNVILKLGWASNLLRQDSDAFRWFDLARKSPDPRVAQEARQGWRNLRADNERFRVSGWMFPVFSTRWHHVFGYGQLKADVRTGIPIRPYVSVRFVGDTRFSTGMPSPLALSESSFIVAAGLATQPWRGIVAWGEAGSALSYRNGHATPDYRGGVSVVQRFRRYAQTGFDAVYISRFDRDVLMYSQNRLGWLSGPLQPYWNANATVDARRQEWANFIELGPGLRITGGPLTSRAFLSVDYVRGSYLIKANNPRPLVYYDLRAGLWYAFTY